MAITKAYIDASIAAGKREIEELKEVTQNMGATVSRIGYAATQVDGVRSLDTNRKLLTAAEQGLTTLRTQLREMRRLCKLIDHRRDRRQNGTYIP
ncbi:hypothetical protein FTO74_14255 [Granulicella sp. WH15]|uniref:hypothetical protein n=1 Tax=Granulicella sp. WH15 TaxID=2602070 RepID=UPI0013675CB0|nr:hypothetical protein [Granulicella sp. WH15]QHN04394.1 hypothetical protein FTO74_14255 [Granulicella sp. WH15]